MEFTEDTARDPAYAILGIIPLWVAWRCAFALNNCINSLLQRPHFSGGTPLLPYVLMLLQASGLSFGLLSGFWILHLGTESLGFVPDVHVHFIGLALIVAVPCLFVGLQQFQVAILDKNAVEGLASEVKLKYVSLVATAVAHTVATALVFLFTFLALDYNSLVTRSVQPWGISVGLVVALAAHYGAAVVAAKLRCLELASLVSTAACVVLFFVTMTGTDIKAEAKMGSVNLYWRHYSQTSLILALHCLVQAVVLVCGSLFGQKGVHNTAAFGVLLGLTLMNGISLVSNNNGVVAPVSILLSWVCCMSVCFSGIGEYIPVGMAAGTGYGLALHLTTRWEAVYSGAGLVAGMLIAVHVTVVMCLHLYTVVTGKEVGDEDKKNK